MNPTYTIGGQPVTAQNGHVLIAMIEDPANLEMTSGLTIANLGFKGQFIGQVVAVDESKQHCVAPGDVVYVKDPDLTGALKVDGGERLYSVRECLVWASVRGVDAKAFSERAQHEAMAMAKNMQKANAGAKLVAPSKQILIAQ